MTKNGALRFTETSSSKLCSVALSRSSRKRVGNFWLDSLNFYRDTDVTGWSFNALVLFVDERVVYTLYGGQPRVHEREVTRNPPARCRVGASR